MNTKKSIGFGQKWHRSRSLSKKLCQGISFALILSSLFFASPTLNAQTVFPNRGGTGTTTPPVANSILIGNANGVYDVKTLTAGSNVTITNSGATLTISSSGSGGGGDQNWEVVDGALTPTTTVGIIVNASSSISELHTADLEATDSFNFLGTLITNVSTWFEGLFDSYATGGTGVTVSSGDISFDCSEVEGTGIDCSGENITLDASGNWSGTFDNQEGTYYLDRTNHTGSQSASTITGGTFGSGSFTFPSDSFSALGLATLDRFTANNGTTTNATSTNLAVSNELKVTPLTSALVQTDGSGIFAEYSGTSCTNQFIRVLSALGIATCATVDLSSDTNFTAGDGISQTGDTVDFACTEVEGTGINCSSNDITLDATGDWTGTIDGNNFSGGAVAQGDLLYGSGAGTIAELTKDANATRYLSNTGTSNNPAWAQVNLSNGVTGDLPFANLTQIAGFSILSKANTGTGDVAALTAGADSVLRRSGSGDLAFSTLVTNNIGDAQITNAKIANMAQSTIKGRAAAAGTGVPTDLTAAQVKTILDLTGTNSGDVTLAGTPDYITISGQVITRDQIDLAADVSGDLPFANLAQGSALSVLGVTGNATADNASIAAGTDHQVLRRSGTSLAFGSVNLAQSAAVTGTLPVGNGGTGASTFATAGVVTTVGGTNVFSSTATSTVTATSPLQISGFGSSITVLADSSSAISLGALAQYPAFTYATSTAWTGTTTIPLGPAYVAETWSGAKCFTDAGSVDVSFYDGTNRMNLFTASTTVGTVTLSTNNSFTASEKRYVDVGNPQSSPTKISCTVKKSVDLTP